MAYLYILGLRILLLEEKTKDWAKNYCHKAGEPNDFIKWRSSGNDLYILLHGLCDDPDNDDFRETGDIHISPVLIRGWLRHESDKTHPLFARLDAMFHIKNSEMRAARRVISDWNKSNKDDQQDALNKLILWIRDRASNSEILPNLKILSKIEEAASSGATGAASVATAVGGLGVGFSDEHWRSIYPEPKKKEPKKKPVMLHR